MAQIPGRDGLHEVAPGLAPSGESGKLTTHEARTLQREFEAMARGEKLPRSNVNQEGASSFKGEYDLSEEVSAVQAAKRAKRMESHMRMLETQRRALEALRIRSDADVDPATLAALPSDIQTTDTILRYAGYFGQAARAVKYGQLVTVPAMDPRIVRGTSIVSCCYILGDVIFEADKAHHIYGEDLNGTVRTATERLLFQVLSSVVLPYATVRAIVTTSRRRVGNSPSMLSRWGPQLAGLAVLPILPMIYDQPCNQLVNTFMWLVCPRAEDIE
jgi:fission process protein 1